MLLFALALKNTNFSRISPLWKRRLHICVVFSTHSYYTLSIPLQISVLVLLTSDGSPKFKFVPAQGSTFIHEKKVTNILLISLYVGSQILTTFRDGPKSSNLILSMLPT